MIMLLLSSVASLDLLLQLEILEKKKRNIYYYTQLVREKTR